MTILKEDGNIAVCTEVLMMSVMAVMGPKSQDLKAKIVT